MALVLGLAFHATSRASDPTKSLDPGTARELAVLARVLEKRLGDVRKALPTAPSPTARNISAPI